MDPLPTCQFSILQELLSVPDEKKRFYKKKVPSVPNEKALLQERQLSVPDEKAFFTRDTVSAK